MARRKAKRRAAPRRRYAKRGHSSKPKTISVTAVAVGGGVAVAVSPKIAGLVAPVRAEVERVTGQTGTGVILLAVGNRILCSLVPKIGAVERAALKPLGLRP